MFLIRSVSTIDKTRWVLTLRRRRSLHTTCPRLPTTALAPPRQLIFTQAPQILNPVPSLKVPRPQHRHAYEASEAVSLEVSPEALGNEHVVQFIIVSNKVRRLSVPKEVISAGECECRPVV